MGSILLVETSTFRHWQFPIIPLATYFSIVLSKKCMQDVKTHMEEQTKN